MNKRNALCMAFVVPLVGTVLVTISLAGESDPAIVAKGEKVYAEKKCAMCHAIKGKGGKSGGDLTDVGAKRDADWLKQFTRAPKSLLPNAQMPAFQCHDPHTAKPRVVRDVLIQAVTTRGATPYAQYPRKEALKVVEFRVFRQGRAAHQTGLHAAMCAVLRRVQLQSWVGPNHRRQDRLRRSPHQPFPVGQRTRYPKDLR